MEAKKRGSWCKKVERIRVWENQQPATAAHLAGLSTSCGVCGDVGRGHSPRRSPPKSLASIRAASGDASATEWEQNRPDCVGREALARDQVHLKPSSHPPMGCRAALFTQHNAKHLLGPIVRATALLLTWAVRMALSFSSE
ncbi:uncharacterized protein AB9W97_010288 [Spinachia spinachia]